jgi:hypothetical protein
MISGPRSRRPIKVVVLVVGFWVAGQLLQAGLAALLAGSGLASEEAAVWPALVVAWGLLFLLSYILRERLDDWLRT